MSSGDIYSLLGIVIAALGLLGALVGGLIKFMAAANGSPGLVEELRQQLKDRDERIDELERELREERQARQDDARRMDQRIDDLQREIRALLVQRGPHQ